MVLMSFEKQHCESCKKITFCVDLRSIVTNTQRQKWICEFCLGFVVGSATLKDKIRKIMITNGIEDIEIAHL